MIQDATFNSTFSLEDTADPNLLQVINLVLAGRSGEIVLKKGTITPRTICFSDTPEGKRAKWEYIKTIPELHEFVMVAFKHFGKLEDVKVYRGQKLEKI